MTEFDLSEKIEWKTGTLGEINQRDVKEFIRLLKEELYSDLCEKGFITLSKECFNRDIIKKIDKLAGDKLDSINAKSKEVKN